MKIYKLKPSSKSVIIDDDNINTKLDKDGK